MTVSVWIGSYWSDGFLTLVLSSSCPASDKIGYWVLQSLVPRSLQLGEWGLQAQGADVDEPAVVVMSFWVTPSSPSNCVTRINPLNPRQPAEMDASFYRPRVVSTENNCTENAFFQSQRHLWPQSPHITATPFSGGRVLSSHS